MGAGSDLRIRREALGLTLRDVEVASKALGARRSRNGDYFLSVSKLSHIERDSSVPTIHELYSIAAIYRFEYGQLLKAYGVFPTEISKDFGLALPSQTHLVEKLAPTANPIPVKLDPSFDFQHTCNLGRMIQKWGIVPVSLLQSLDLPNYTYAYIGTEDATMYPVLLPGSFLQIDESKRGISTGPWRSILERPIYFVELRGGFACSYCQITGNEIVLQAHPQSGAPTRVFKHPQDAEVLGQVVGVAMRLDGWTDAELKKEPKAFQAPQ